MTNTLRGILLGCALSWAAVASAQQSCANFVTLANAALIPDVGSSTLVQQMMSGAATWTQQPLSTRFDPRQAAAILDDGFRPSRACASNRERRADPAAFACEYTSRRSLETGLEVEMPKGRITYLNPSRRFDPSGPDNDIGLTQAIEVAATTAQGLGVPANEIETALAIAHPVRLFHIDHAQGNQRRSRRIEVMARVERKVNGWPVFDSSVQVAVNNEGKPARVHVVWPDFTLAQTATTTRTRQQLVDAIVERFGELGGCTSFVGAKAQVGWIANRDGDTNDEDGGTTASGRYVPGIRVVAIPPSTADSPQAGGFVHTFYLPLVVATATDS